MGEVYQNTKSDAVVRDVRFVLKDDALLALVRARAGEALPDGLLTEAGLTPVSDVTQGASRLIVARISKTPEETVQKLSCAAGTLTPPVPVAKGFNPWLWRGITSFVGQSLQLLSSFVSVSKKDGVNHADKNAVFTFASMNLIANVSNIVFGSQKKEDTHQLHILESKVNEIAQQGGATGKLPDPQEKRVALHKEEDPHRNFGQQTYDVLQKFSVTGGEIGLRTLGSAGLAFPMKHWLDGARALRQTGSIKQTYNVMRNPTPSTFRVGLIMLTGKFVSLLSKEPDPFNPNPQTLWDKIREKVTFRASSLIEGGAAVYMMQDRYNNYEIPVGKKRMCDWAGASGNAVFIGGYGIRLFAPYGSREVKMRELYAHSADALAHVPREKIPEQLARTVMMLDEHFGEKSVGVDTMYSELAQRLKSYHNIDVLKPVNAPAPKPQGPAIAENVPMADAAREVPGTWVKDIASHEAALAAAPALAKA